MKIKVWMPTHDMRAAMQYTHGQLPRDIVEFLKRGWSVSYDYSSSCDLNGMRNSALEAARSEEFDWLVMQDADVYADGGAAAQLIDVCKEHDATACVAAVGLRQIERTRIRMNVLPFEADAVFEVERAGTGLIAIDIAKINVMAEEHEGPWFWREYEDKRCSTQKVGQDIYFTYLVRSLDGKVMCDSRIETNHPCLNTDHLNYIPEVVKHVVPS